VLNDPVNLIDPDGLHGWGFFRGRFRIPPRLRYNPKPKPRTSPKREPKWEPTDPPTDEQLGLPRDDLYWNQEPEPPTPKPYNPNNPPKPMAPIMPWEDFGNPEEPYDRLWNRGGCT
jgi:hypothetical protein